MSTTSISSLLSSLGSGSTTQTLSQLLGNPASGSSTGSTSAAAIQSAVNAILNSASNTSGSGINVSATVDAILQIDAAPEQNLQNRVTSLNAQTAALQSLQSNINDFQTALEALTSYSGDFGALTVSSSNNNLVSATAANGTVAGTHVITVSHLATTSAEYTNSFSSATGQLPTGQFKLTVGANSAVTIPVDSGDGTDTLSGLAAYINKQDLGVNASVIADNSGSRLALVSRTTGAAGQITITDDTTSADNSSAFASGSAKLSDGSFDLQIGSNVAVTIPVDGADKTNTLSGLASYINQQHLGVTASVVTSALGSSLSLVPQSTGAAGVISVSNDTTGSGNGMGFPGTYPTTPAAGNGMGFTDAVDGTDASLTVDGIPVDFGSNTVTGVIPGVTLTLSGVTQTSSGQTGTPVTIGITPNLNAVSTDMNSFVTSWNTLIGAINAGIQSNATSGAAGNFSGDPSIDFLQEQLLSSIGSSMSGNNHIVNLQSMGISFQNDGTLSVDSTVLNGALQNNFADVQNLFQSTTGVGSQIQLNINFLSNPVTGPLNADINGIRSEITGLNSQISDFQLRLQGEKTRLLAEYNQVNALLEQLPQMLAQINSQLDALNPSK